MSPVWSGTGKSFTFWKGEQMRILVACEESQAVTIELARYEIEKIETPVDTTNRYTVTIPESDLNGTNINEMALIDADGGLAAIKTFLNKGKDGDVEFTFQFDDEF